MPDRTTGGRDELSRRLHDLRKAAGLSGMRVAELTGTSQGKISRTENGRVGADPEFIEQLCRLYEAPAAERRELVAIAKDVQAGNRRLVLRRDTAGVQAQIGRIMKQSALVRTFSPSGLPGLLQTPDYIRAVFHASARRNLEGAEAGIAQRVRNQAILDDETTRRRFVMLVPEGSLGWAILPPEGMAEQIDHIAAATRRRNVRVGIIPWGANSPVLPLHSWDLYDARFVMAGATHATAKLTDRVDVEAYVRLTDQIEQLAVFDDDARAILEQVAVRYRGLGL
jgi:transcriptional regulator with XRE-family HTH domain